MNGSLVPSERGADALDLGAISEPLAVFAFSLANGRKVSDEAAAKPTHRIICLLISSAARESLASYSACLNGEERQDIARYAKLSRQLSMTAARVALRAALCDLARQRFPGDIAFKKAELGKLLVACPEGYHASVSHTEKLTSVAAAAGLALGIDVESTDFVPGGPMLAAFLSRKEARQLARADADLRRERFLRAWTVKEALVKLTGAGLSEHSTRREVPERDGAFVYTTDEGGRCLVFSSRVADLTGSPARGHLALAIAAPLEARAAVVRLEFRHVANPVREAEAEGQRGLTPALPEHG